MGHVSVEEKPLLILDPTMALRANRFLSLCLLLIFPKSKGVDGSSSVSQSFPLTTIRHGCFV